jgi:hypothetical protein
MVTEYGCKIPTKLLSAVEFGDYSGLSAKEAAIIDQNLLPALRALIVDNNADYYTISYDADTTKIDLYDQMFRGLAEIGPVTECTINIIRR